MKKLLTALLLLLFAKANALPNDNDFVRFTRNDGQWDKAFLYEADVPGGFMYLKTNGLHYTFYDAQAMDDLRHHKKENTTNTRITQESINCHGIDVTFVGANSNPTIVGNLKTADTKHYFLGDESHWASNVPSFGEILYKNLYEGIDLRIYTYRFSLKYEFIVHAGADANQIKISYNGANQLAIENGNLVVKTTLGNVTEMKPYCFQEQNKIAEDVAANFVLKGNEMQYNFPNNYDKTRTLTIDPKLVFSSYSGSTADNWGNTATYDSDGNLYAVGCTLAGGGAFPATAGAYQTSNGGYWDVAVLKFSPDGITLLYASYLGGSGADIPHSVICNTKNELLIFGSTSSSNFPTTKKAYDRTFNGGQVTTRLGTGQNFTLGSDIFVSRLTKNGDVLLGSTYVGGSGNDGLSSTDFDLAITNYGDDYRGEIVTDAQDNVYIASMTTSTDFPLVKASQTAWSGNSDAVVMRLNPDLSDLEWSTLLGGNGFDTGFSIKVGKSGSVYICGGTNSTNLKATGYRKNKGGSEDGYVARYDNFALAALTYVGTDNADILYLMDIDAQENVHVFGLTKGAYPVSSGVYGNAKSGQFIQAMTKDLNTGLYSTVIGTGRGEPDIVPTAFLINDCGNIYLAGWGGKTNDHVANNPRTTTAMPVTADAYRSTTDGSNFYIAMLEAGAKSLLYATFMGSNYPEPSQSAGDHVDGGTCRFDKSGVIYHAACSCNRPQANSNFSTSPGAWSNSNNASNCNNVGFKFDIDNLKVSFNAVSNTQSSPSSKTDTLLGCSPFLVTFTNTSEGGKTYNWNIGNFKQSTVATAESYTFDKAGTYTVTLTGVNPLTCKREEIARKVIKVVSNNFAATPNFAGCEGQKIQLSASGGLSYTWSPAEGLSAVNIPNPTLTISKSNTYTVEISDNKSCKEKKTVTVTLDNSFAKTSKDTSVCAGGNITILASGGTAYKWTTADGINDVTKASQTVKVSKTSTYTVEITNATLGCKTQKSINVSIDNSFGKIGADTTVCEGGMMILRASGGTKYRWQPAEEIADTTIASPKITIKKAGIFTVTITNETTGCTAQKSITVSLDKSYTPDFEASVTSGCGLPTLVNLKYTGKTTNPTLTWAMGNGDSLRTANPDPYRYKKDGTYTVTLFGNKQGCKAIALSKPIEVEKEFTIPNVITPNGDGKNDTFVVGVPLKKLEIYDRWGSALLQTDNYQNDWGKGLNHGTYYYYLVSKQGVECKGWVEVLE